MKDSTKSNFFRIHYGQSAIRSWAITYLLTYLSFGYVDYLAAPVSYTSLWVIRVAVVPFFLSSILSTYLETLKPYRRLINSFLVFSVPFSIILMISQVGVAEWARYLYFAGIVLSVFPIGFILMRFRISFLIMLILAISYVLIIGIGLDYAEVKIPFFLMSSFFVFAGFLASLLSTYLLESNHRKILQQSQELESLVSLKDQFISILAHDLKAPCTNVSGFADLYLRNPESFETTETTFLVHEMKKSATGMQALLQNLLEWSKVKSNRQNVLPTLFKVNDLVQDNLDFASGAAKLKNIELVGEGLQQSLTIYSDRNMLSTTLRNLISNAIKFSYSGGRVVVSIGIDRDVLEVVVRDNGVGIAKERTRQLFELIENKSTPGTDKEPGSGLGLILCKEMIEKCGGNISVQSKEDEGTTFLVRLPIYLPK